MFFQFLVKGVRGQIKPMDAYGKRRGPAAAMAQSPKCELVLITVHYERVLLLNRLSVGFGVSGSVLTWLKSYLTGRYQCVRVRQASSSHTLCHTGVPQGSVLGPILFSCYISPISCIANTFGVGIQQYADDT